MKIKLIITVMVCGMLILGGCAKVLDKKDLAAIDPSQVWSNADLANAYLNNIYAALMPGNPGSSDNGTDEEVPYQRQTSGWLLGTITPDNVPDGFGVYSTIRKINIILANVAHATFADSSKNYIEGQAFFWRAWAYYGLVKDYGGVPLVLTVESPNNIDSLYLPRSSTSVCVSQIVSDLDSAINLLPDAWSGSNYGKIDKAAAMAFKGRVLLFFASPLFNPTDDQTKWQQAYNACLAAKNFCDAQGKGLYPNYAGIWNNQPNEEDVMVREFNYPQSTYFQGGILPTFLSKDETGVDRPSLDLVNAFPRKDGSSWNTATMNYDTLFRDRDDRFYATIYYNGDPYQYFAGLKQANTYVWTYYDTIYSVNAAAGIEGTYNPVTFETLPSGSSFYRIKAVDTTLTQGTVYNAEVWWPEIRYAEVLMNYGEAANEVGKTNEALQVLYAIRDRAGILPGPNGNYGITANTQAEIRQAYINERFVEFAFEGKRWDDLRRWQRFDILNDLQQRHGLAIELKTGQQEVQPLSNINSVWNRFTSFSYGTDKQDITIPDKEYIYPIPTSELQSDPKLAQDKDWGGTFDPLQ